MADKRQTTPRRALGRKARKTPRRVPATRAELGARHANVEAAQELEDARKDASQAAQELEAARKNAAQANGPF